MPSPFDGIARFFKDLTRSNTEVQAENQTLTDEKASAGARAMSGALQGMATGLDFTVSPLAGDAVRSLASELGVNVSSRQELESTLFDWVTEQVRALLGIPLIERPEGSEADAGATAEGEAAIFAASVIEAQNAALSGTLAVMALNTAAAVADGAMQGATLGQARLFQELVQNVIWATGLSDMGGLSFRPQIAASVAPLLERHYNSVAQAQIPSSGDLIRFLVREVFDPQRRKDLEADKTPEQLREFMRQRGFSSFWTDSYWAAHWNLLSQTQLDEAVHRGVISEDEWERQTRLNDVVPEGIPWLKQIIYSPFTRVDVRRMADLGLLEEKDLLQAYADIGYFAPKDDNTPHRARFASEAGEVFDPTIHKAEALVIFTRVFNALPDIRRRLANGHITASTVEPEIRSLGVPEDTARRLTETLVKASDLGGAQPVRELTTAQIVRGAREGLIGFGQALFLLEQIGWSQARAEFMLRLRVAPEEAPTASELGRRLLRDAGL